MSGRAELCQGGGIVSGTREAELCQVGGILSDIMSRPSPDRVYKSTQYSTIVHRTVHRGCRVRHLEFKKIHILSVICCIVKPETTGIEKYFRCLNFPLKVKNV